jgi:hypothetical protein
MKVNELASVIDRVAQIHRRLGSTQSSDALSELASILSDCDHEDVKKLVQMLRKGEPTVRKSRTRKKVSKHA